MTVKERRSLLKDLRKFGVAEWSYSFTTGETKIVFAHESRLSEPAGQRSSQVPPGQTSPKERDMAAHVPGGPGGNDNPYQELASAVGLDWARISGQHAGETD